MAIKNGLFLLLDALRYDVLADPQGSALIAPNLARLARRGFVRRVVTNAQSTQFVMPSLFSLTYPLDHGGYNSGIRDRPKSFVELLQGAGFETHLLATCNQLGLTLGFDRGFNTIQTTSDYRTLLEQRIGRTLRYELELSQKGERSISEASAVVVQELRLLLDGIIQGIEGHDKSLWPPRLRRLNERVARGCREEKDLLSRDPDRVIEKLLHVAPGLYWRFLGQRMPGAIRLLWHRAVASIIWRTVGLVAKQTLWPFLVLTHYPVSLGDVITPLCRFIENAKGRRWFAHMHTMDIHDCRAVNQPLHVLARLRFLPRWVYARLSGRTKRRWLYDTAVMYVDHHVGQLIRTLERSGQIDDTVILVTGDHGSHYAESPRKKQSVGWRTHYEDIEVPLLLANSDRSPSNEGLLDSMGVTSTFLEAMGVSGHQSFKGRSAFGPGRVAVISESCGHGNADLARRDIYFTVTTQTHRMMTLLSGRSLKVEELYDLRNDPREITNLAGQPSQAGTIAELLEHLRSERGEILSLRDA